MYLLQQMQLLNQTIFILGLLAILSILDDAFLPSQFSLQVGHSKNLTINCIKSEDRLKLNMY